MKKLFGTDGIRGVANQYPMTAEVALSVGRALAHVFGNGGNARPRFLIGKDTRLSGYMIEMALASGICSMGADALLIGPMPTPGIAFLTQAMRADAGIVISASHNPFQDNGIKIFCRHGFKLPDDYERKIENLVLSKEIDHLRPTAEKVGKASRVEDSKGRYIEFVKSTFPKDLTLEGFKIVVDCANGANYSIAPTVLQELGATVTVLGDEPNGRNINKGVGAIFPEVMAQKVKEVGADIGIALDGDGDRAIFADETGRVVDGDAILVVCAEELLRRGALKNKTLVTTVMSNQAVEEYLAGCGGTVVRSQVGDRYVVEAMREKGLNFGGEASGHLVFLDHSTTGDGLIASLQVLALMRNQEKKFSEIVSRYRPYPQILTSVRVRERKDLGLFPDLQEMIADFERDLGKQGRLLVRYSGTEPIVRIMIEGMEDSVIKKMATDLTYCISKNLT
jgi:phosphoglucosamine mutase